MRPGSSPDAERVAPAVAQLRTFIEEACARYPVDQHKVVALGFSQGGMMAYNVAMKWPERFAALVGIGTAFPDYLADNVSDRSRETIQQLPTMVQHGRADPMLEIARARKSVEIMRSLKMRVIFREYDGGHEVTADGIRDLSAFLMEKVVDRNAR
jgi:phospholipase/carboxylesterase